MQRLLAEAVGEWGGRIYIDQWSLTVVHSSVVATRRTLTDELRAAIDASPMSRYAICRAIDLDPAVMSRFMSGQRGLSLETLDKLAKLLDLHIVTGKRTRRVKP